MASISAVEWYAKEHAKLLIELENKELSIGEYAVKHHDILQKAKAIEDLTDLKKKQINFQDQVPEVRKEVSAVEWLFSQIILSEWTSTPEGYAVLGIANKMFEEQMFESFKAGQDSMEEGGKNFEQYYHRTYKNEKS